jgi:hypothetical protein
MLEEYKQKEKVEYGEEGRQKQLEQAGSEQSTELPPFDENGNILQDSNLAENGSVGPVEDVSEDFSQMSRGPDVLTESEKRLETRLTELGQKRIS